MQYTCNEDRLTITANEEERAWLRELVGPVGEHGETTRPYSQIEADALEPLVCNSELDWIRPEEIGALTGAPILGIYGEERDLPIGTNGSNVRIAWADNQKGVVKYLPVVNAWGYASYAVRSFVDDLIEDGATTFASSF